jgi:hypothetical protein
MLFFSSGMFEDLLIFPRVLKSQNDTLCVGLFICCVTTLRPFLAVHSASFSSGNLCGVFFLLFCFFRWYWGLNSGPLP